ncbi:HET-domain-containing protein, partial [Bimuria novae-zelandiae CBS 107.79]
MALYASLSSDADTDAFDIRLLKLQPSNDRSAPIYCKLVTYPLNSGRSHLYECLSYVWGSPEGRKAIYMHSNDTQIEVLATPNLHAALVQLRDPFFERILWVDAVCINQQDEREKTQQVAAMARIYGLANRVVVWLGGEVDNSALAFQELRNLSQSQQPVDHFSPEAARIFTADSSRNYNAETCNADVVLAIHALLNRPYFRRMWILQEVTAARNILFVCGEAELQTATFLSGLEALPDFDDWKLRNRIRAFILLIQRSAYRESLKSQAHLNIDTLINLIDRFHSNDATDPRDKIYALWGLCSDSTMMATMQPDYGKTWQNLLEDLGKAIFGDDTVLAASSIKQMLFVRGGCYDLGKVEDVSSATTWAMEQEIRITSMGASMFLEDDYRWSQTIKMRTAAEQIANDDIVLVLPKARRLIVARPYEYYFRIVSVVDTSSTQVFEPGRKRSEGTWVSWEPFLRRIDRLTNEVPLIWNWE